MGTPIKVAYAYCAGLIDGEGCICISKKKTYGKDGKKYQMFGMEIAVEITATTKPLDYLKGIFGGYVYERKKGWNKNSFSQGNKNGWRFFRWTIGSDRALEALKKMKPYFKIKRNQAEVAIEFQKHLKRTRYKYNMIDYPKIREYRENLYNKLREMKRNRAGVETKPSKNESSSDSPILGETLVN